MSELCTALSPMFTPGEPHLQAGYCYCYCYWNTGLENVCESKTKKKDKNKHMAHYLRGPFERKNGETAISEFEKERDENKD